MMDNIKSWKDIARSEKELSTKPKKWGEEMEST